MDTSLKTVAIIIFNLFSQFLLAICSAPCEFLPEGCKSGFEYSYQPLPQIHHTPILPSLPLPAPAIDLDHHPYLEHHHSDHQYHYPHDHPYVQHPLNNKKQVYLPALPGNQPRCVKPGFTFCEQVEKYPGDLIRTLITGAHINFRNLLVDESGPRRNSQKGNVNSGSTQREKASQRANQNAGQNPNKSSQIHNHGLPAFANGNANSQGLNQSSQFGGYPTRQYPLDESSIKLIDPVLYASYNNLATYSTPGEWRKRDDQSNVGHAGELAPQNRSRRQSNRTSIVTAGNELCPTKSQFIMPRAALNKQGQWRFVVNIQEGPEKYTQLVGSETCLVSYTDDLGGPAWWATHATSGSLNPLVKLLNAMEYARFRMDILLDANKSMCRNGSSPWKALEMIFTQIFFGFLTVAFVKSHQILHEVY